MNWSRITGVLQNKSFVPHSLFRNAHAQTLLGYLHPRRLKLRFRPRPEKRLFGVSPGVKIMAHCDWQIGERRNAGPTLLLVHGLEGSSRSVYMLSTAATAFAAGFNVVRLNLRTCGGTEHLTTTLYHSGMSEDLRLVINELIVRDKVESIFLGGFSLGGNMSLKLAGEWGTNVPRELRGVCAISPSIDLAASAAVISHSSNRLYNQRFISSLKKKMRRLKQLYPELYGVENVRRLRTIRDFDTQFTAPYGGFKDVDDYYARSSSLQFIGQIRVPTLVIQAQDDPFVPFDAFRSPVFKDNSFVTLLAPPRGGHVGFIASENPNGENRFWAENRLVEFCRLIEEYNLAQPTSREQRTATRA